MMRMNIEYINPFIEASQIVIQNTANLQVKLGKVFVRNKPYDANIPLIEVGLIGKIQGKAALSMQLPVAFEIISHMMMGMPVSQLDEIGKSALSELANMIMGNTATILYNKGIGIDITTPTTVICDGAMLPPADMKTVSIPLLLDDRGSIELDISVKE